MHTDDLIITLAYFSIPVQILASLWQYPRLASMPLSLLVLLILFALFIFCCGAGHLLRCLDMHDTLAHTYVNGFTAFISLLTAVYLLPLVPSLMSSLDDSLQSLIRLNDETAESRRKLITFMAFLCHEIRNPLFAITATLTFLSDDDSLTHEQEQALSSISQSADLMLRLVNDVLDIGKLEAGKLKVEQQNFMLREMLQNVANSAKTQALQQKHKINFQFFLSDQVPAVICSDAVRILQICYNLLSNAFKFTEQGYVHFSVSIQDFDQACARGFILNENAPATDLDMCSMDFSVCLLDDAERGARPQANNCVVLKIQVTDTGIGIPEDRLERIFQPYSQSKMSDYRRYGGTGLGLSIVARLCQNMDGSISVESKENRGSTFTVYLPVQVAQDAPREETANLIEQSTGRARLPELIVSPEKRPEVASTDMVETADLLSSPIVKRSPEQIFKQKEKLPPLDLPSGDSYVLVVDDNALNRKLIGRMLSQFHVQYHQACDGQAAVDAICASRNVTGDPGAAHYGLILMDLSMPVMDGCQAIRILRSRGLTIPIIALTANALDGHRNEAMEAGATEFQTKPILRDELYRKCQEYLVVARRDEPSVV